MPHAATELLDAPALVGAPEAEPAQPAAAGTDGEITGSGPDEIVAADLLVEEISIDGMCGVY
jgi:mycofactocin precursor